MTETAEGVFRTLMKLRVDDGDLTVQQMRAYIDKMRDDLTWELTGRKNDWYTSSCHSNCHSDCCSTRIGIYRDARICIWRVVTMTDYCISCKHCRTHIPATQYYCKLNAVERLPESICIWDTKKYPSKFESQVSIHTNILTYRQQLLMEEAERILTFLKEMKWATPTTDVSLNIPTTAAHPKTGRTLNAAEHCHW